AGGEDQVGDRLTVVGERRAGGGVHADLLAVALEGAGQGRGAPLGEDHLVPGAAAEAVLPLVQPEEPHQGEPAVVAFELRDPFAMPGRDLLLVGDGSRRKAGEQGEQGEGDPGRQDAMVLHRTPPERATTRWTR